VTANGEKDNRGSTTTAPQARTQQVTEQKKWRRRQLKATRAAQASQIKQSVKLLANEG
jgi:hypothetical protein